MKTAITSRELHKFHGATPSVISNVYAREEFRHKSMISSIAKGVLCGFGSLGYSLGLTAMKDILENNQKDGAS